MGLCSCEQACITSTDTLRKKKLAKRDIPMQLVNVHVHLHVHVHVCVVTFYFTLKPITALLGAGFLVRFLVVLLGALTAVVDPFNGVLLNKLRKKNRFNLDI